MNEMPETYHCRICLKGFHDKTALVEHLRADHEPLEIESYTAATMMMEDDRDKVARDFFREFEHLRRELRGNDLRPCPTCGKLVRLERNGAGKLVQVKADGSSHEHPE
jgi:hypothetical protein